MKQVAACPGAELMKKILSGQATPAEGEAFGVHLETCPACADALDRALTGDTLVDAMRSQSTVEDRSEPALPSLIDRLLQLRAKRGPVSSATVDFSAGGTQSPKSKAPIEGHEVLSPAQSSDELGRIGTFRVLKVLGSGGMGLVFQAEDVHLKRMVALKVMKPNAAAQPGARERFLREAQAAAAIEHEHIVTIHHVGEENGAPFVAMQWLKGMSLEDALKKGPLKPGQIVRVGRQVALGLAAAHEHGLIHRDIKPANLWIEPTGGGKVKILDFGLARSLNDELHLTQSGAIIGTPAYMAPEQARGDKVDHRCDLFSLGVVLYRMATGKMPFRGESYMALLTALALDTPPSPLEVNPAIPAELSELIMELMEKDPAKRPATAKAIADRLTRVGQALARASEKPGETATADVFTANPPQPKPQPKPPAAPPKRPRRRWPLALAAGLLAAALIAASVVVFVQTPQGTIRIEIDDDNLQATLTKTGATITRADTGREIRVAPSDDQTLKVELRDKQGNKTEFFTDRFQLKSGETVTLKVELLPGVVQVVQGGQVIGKKDRPVGPADHRRVAELALSLGGYVNVYEVEGPIQTSQQLPAGEFEIHSIGIQRKKLTDTHVKQLVKQLVGMRRFLDLDLGNNPEITDASLDAIAGMEEIESLHFDQAKLTDAGIKKLVHLKKLKCLGLDSTRITDAAIKDLVSMPSLQSLNINLCPVTKSGLSQLAQKRTWTQLFLMQTPVADEHLMELAKGDQLSTLRISNVKLTRAGIQSIGKMTKLVDGAFESTGLTDDSLDPILDLPLKVLNLNGNSLTDAGVQKLTRLKKLETLDLDSVSIRDTGLAALAGMNLRWLALNNTKVTAPAIDAFLTANPNCTVRNNGQIAQAGKKPATRNHRTASDWALSLGGSVALTIDAAKGHYQYLKKGDELPPGDWTMTIIVSNKKVTDSSLAELSGATKLRHLVAPNNPITDDGIKHLANHHLMTNLDLDHTQITDAGLKEVLAMKSIAHLRIGGTKVTVLGIEEVVRRPASQFEGLGMSELPVTDAILRDLTKFRRLNVLYLDRTKVTEEGLKELHQFDDLRTIWLSENRLGDAAVDELLKCPKLDFVSLNGNPISDAGVKKLAQLKSLRLLHISQTAVTDAGLAELAAMLSTQANPALKVLVVQGTKVTAKGLAAFHAAVPGCEIQHDGGTIQPDVLVRTERTAAEWALSIGSGVVLEKDGKSLKVYPGEKLPPDPWILRTVLLSRKKQVTDAELDRLSGCSGILALAIDGTSVTDKGLPSLAPMKKLVSLNLSNLPISDAGLKEIRVLKTLESINLSNTAVTKDGLDHLVREGNPKLRWLYLSGLPVTDRTLKDLTPFSELSALTLGKTQVTDAGSNELSRFKKLYWVDLNQNGLSDAAVDALVELQLHNLYLEGNRLTDVGVKKLARIKSLQLLAIGDNPGITDEGLAALHGLGLGRIHINGTKITEKGVAAFRARVPGCTVDYGGRWIEPLAASRNDRTAVQWALSVGGIVTVRHKDQFHRINKIEDLPEGEWTMTIQVAGKNLTDADVIELSGAARLEHLVLDWNPALTSACVKHLANLHEMTNLQISGTQLTNAGLKDLLALKSLGVFNFSSTRVTQAGIEDLIRQPATRFQSLGLGGLPVTDALLKDLSKFRRLGFLNLSQTKVTEEGLKELRQFQNLDWLILQNNDLSDAVVEELLHLPKLATVELDGNPITDAGFKRLAQIKSLVRISATNTRMTDEGLAALAARPGPAFASLQVQGTKVTAKGIAAFRAAHPRCEIGHDVAPDPKSVRSDRAAPEWVLSMGGWTVINVRVDNDEATDASLRE